MIPTAPGVYYDDVSMEEYLAIRALSSGVARKVVDYCPKAAWADSYLNPNREPDDTHASDIGTIAHGIVLEGSTDGVQVIDPADYPAKTTGEAPKGWTNANIRAARDAARADGKVPILLPDWHKVKQQVNACHQFILSLEHTEPAFVLAFGKDGGRSEVTYVWQEGPTLCKARIDRINNQSKLAIHYKTSAMSVEPNRWARTQMIQQGMYFTAAWYRRGILMTTGVESEQVFLCQEVEPPYLCSVSGLDPHTFAFGAEKVVAAIDVWQRCAEKYEWPGYPNRICYPELPAWEMTRWVDQQTSNPALAGIDYASQG